MFDLKIEGAEVIDGTGRPGSRADVGIRDDKIVKRRLICDHIEKTRRIRVTEHFAQRRISQVCVNQQRAIAAPCQKIGEARGNSCLSFARKSRDHSNDLAPLGMQVDSHF